MSEPLDAFTRAYITAALWSSTDDDSEPLDKDHDWTDLAPETLDKMADDCSEFQRVNSELLAVAYRSDVFIQGERYDDSAAGHDFWLTRCGHGVGFWDRGLGSVGDELTDACEAWPNVDLYIGDDGKIYQG